MAMRAEKAAFRCREILSPWKTFLGEMSHKNMENQCSPMTRNTQ